jgi:uncharacterized protein
MTKRSAEPFTVMAKPVGPRCNLACSYCYYLETEGMYGGELSPKMSDGLLETYIRNYIEASPGPVVSFIWHGGEPTLAGLEFYRKAVELQERYLPPGWSCWNNLQTNGILLDDEWCSFLAEARFDVGLSIDGNESTHDTYRRDRGGHGTYERVAQAARRLKAHGIRPDLLCTVTSTAADDPVGVYRALRDLDTGWVQFIPIVRRDAEGNVTPDSVTPEGYGDFLCAVFDEWARNDIGRLEIQQVAEMGLVWSGGSTNLCWMAPTCGRVLVVEQDGAVYSCDHFVMPEHRIGDIMTSSLAELVDAPVQQSFGYAKRDRLPRQCLTCSWLDVCNGGCPKDRFAVTGEGEAGLNYLCDGLRKFFAHAERRIRRIVDLRRMGRKPPEIMAQLRADARERWRGVGRNDPCPCGSGRKAKHCCWDRRP